MLLSNAVRERAPSAPGNARPRPSRGPAVVVLSLIAVGWAWGFATLPWQAMTILAVASIAALVGWLRTSYAYPVRSRGAIAAYLCAIAFQFVHMSEEYNGHFPHEFTLLFHTNHNWTEHAFLLVFVFGFGAVWTLAAAGALYQIRIANYFMWFYALGAGLINAISHFIFPIIKGGYFPGLYTAGGHLIFSALVLVLLVRDSRTQRQAELAGPGRG